jgi:methylenetetrahydrofolate reductase (NADPH)
MDIGVAGYPEKHPESTSLSSDIEHLKQKVDAGASVILTQLFFSNTHFFRYMELVRNAGIQAPIIPGIMPLTNIKQIGKIVELSGAEIPPELNNAVTKYPDDETAVKEIGIEYATKQIQELTAFGVPGIHFYTLNKSEIALRVLRNLTTLHA